MSKQTIEWKFNLGNDEHKYLHFTLTGQSQYEFALNIVNMHFWEFVDILLIYICLANSLLFSLLL